MNSSHWANLVSQGGVISTVWKSKINLWGLWLFLLLWARWFDDNIFQLKILHQSDTWWLNSLLVLFVFLSWKRACMENKPLRHLVSPPPPLLCPLGCKQHWRASHIDPRVWVVSILSANISRVIWELIFFIVRDKPWLGWRRGRVGYTSAGCLGLSNNSQTCGNCLKKLFFFLSRRHFNNMAHTYPWAKYHDIYRVSKKNYPSRNSQEQIQMICRDKFGPLWTVWSTT